MKYGWVVLLLLVGVVAPKSAKAQAELYGEFSIGQLSNPVQTFYLYGATTGIVVDGPTVFHRMVISADIQGRFVHRTGEQMNGVTAGPRFSFPFKKHGITPYGELMVGFARFNNNADPSQNATTDGTLQINGGVEKQVSPRWDVVADYSYSQYYAFGGEYNPKTYSLGAVFHFEKR